MKNRTNIEASSPSLTTLKSDSFSTLLAIEEQEEPIDSGSLQLDLSRRNRRLIASMVKVQKRLKTQLFLVQLVKTCL